MNRSTFNKRIFTLDTFAVSARTLFAHLPDVAAAFTRHTLSRAFTEKIMLAVTRVNGCRYCSYAHVRLALQSGVNDAELRDLLAGELDHIPPDEQTAILFAQHYAEQGDRYDATAWQTLEQSYGTEIAREMLVHIRLISFANLYGNTFDALLERLKFRPVKGSRFLDEIVVLLAGATIVPVGLLAGVIFQRLRTWVPRASAKPPHD